MNDAQIKELEKLIDLTPTFAGKKRLLDSTDGVEYITSGSARAVYKVSDNKVIKLAKNNKGIAQNETEADWALKNYGVAAEWYDISKDGYWIESEFCQKCSIPTFKNITGWSFKDFCACIDYYYRERNGSRYYKPSKPDNYDDSWNDEFIESFYTYIGDFDVPIGDLTRISSYGINHNGEIVLVDTGLSNSVYEKHYKRESVASENEKDIFMESIYFEALSLK